MFIPSSVPNHMHATYRAHYQRFTKGTDRALLFSADQKLEHLHKDFWGEGIDPDDATPAHLFNIASQAPLGGFATHFGLIAQWAQDYPTIPYIVKLNGKSDVTTYDPESKLLWTVDDIMKHAQERSYVIIGIGITIYLGSSFEASMLAQAAQQIKRAHEHGLITILWAYAQGEHITNRRDGLLCAGLTGVAASLGADFVKIHPPLDDTQGSRHEWLARAVQAAGKTKVLCSGGPYKETHEFLKEVYDDLHYGHCAGVAVGRNIHQRSAHDAHALLMALAALVYKNTSLQEAQKILTT